MPVRKSSLPRLPCPPIKEKAFMKQGIVTILRPDPEKPKSAPASIRRTLSADMSSKKWLELKKIASFKEGPVNHPDSSSESEEDDQNRLGRDDIWKSIQQEKEEREIPKPNVWGSLVKSEKCKSDLPPPYVHPLVKRSASTLSEKSLEICTESLGSETGSDCFSPHRASDEEKEEGHKAFVQEETVKESNPFEDLQVNKYKMSPVRPFPPPIPSIAGGDGASLHMHSKRENGRLVLEAVSVPSRNYFHAQRQDGRLVLTLINAHDEVVEENKGEVFDNMDEVDIDEGDNQRRDDDAYSDEEEEEEENIETKNVAKELEFVKSTRSGMISVHKTGLVMKKLVAQGNKNPVWTNKVVNTITGGEGVEVPQSLPPLPWVARIIPTPPSPPDTVGSFNAYDYFWRKNTTPGSIIAAPQSAQIKNNHYNNKINGGNQDLVIIKEKEEKFSPYLRACKDGRRSLLIWEPYCIATS